MITAARPVLAAWAAARESEGKAGNALLAAIEKRKAKYANVGNAEMMAIMLDDPVEGLVD